MPLDQYSPCPCGSGKKLKFCKCVEQPQDYEKLMRLIEGGQELAAMDRINQMLSKTPNAAWLLALKGELALGMQELETFKETANRFLKLKPDNPLALIMKSLASSLASEPVENSANYLLGGLAESRDSVPAMTIMAIDLLIRQLANSGKLSLAGYWGDLQHMLAGDQQNSGESVLQDESLNLIAKVPARLVEDPPASPWKERLAEVISLSRIFSFAQAETKLRAILRDFPDQPGPLSHLLRAQMAQLNQQGSHATARKLAEHLEVPVDDRAYFSALALELESEHQSLRPEAVTRYSEIDSVDRVAEAFLAVDHIQEIDDESGERVKQFYAAYVGDEVPAKRVFTIFDHAPLMPKMTDGGIVLASGSGESEPQERSIAGSVATVVLFGKQTDKPARALLLATRFVPYQSRIEETLELLQLGADVETGTDPLTRTYAEFLQRAKVVVGRREPPSLDEAGQSLIEDFLNLPFQLFDGATPLQVAGEERFRGDLLGLLCHLEGEQNIIVPATTIGELYRRLGLERPAPKIGTVAGKLSVTNILDLDRLDINTLSDEHLQGVLMRAMSLGASRVIYHCAVAALGREGLANNAQTQLMARSVLRMMASSFEEKIEHSHALLELLTALKAPVGKVAIELLSMLHALGRNDEAQEMLKATLTANPNDPYLMSFMQHVMQQERGAGMGAGADLASRMSQRAASAEASSGLVLPGQDASAPQGESKLWLPGS